MDERIQRTDGRLDGMIVRLIHCIDFMKVIEKISTLSTLNILDKHFKNVKEWF